MGDDWTRMLNRLHVEAQCCGTNSWTDFIDTPWAALESSAYLVVPASCCVNQRAQTLQYCQIEGDREFYHRTGCHEKIKESISMIECDTKVSAYFTSAPANRISLVCIYTHSRI